MTSFPVNSGKSLITHGKGKVAYKYGYQMNANSEKKSRYNNVQLIFG